MQGINQGFRVIGGKTKVAGVKVRAFKMGDKITIDDLNARIPQQFEVDINKIYAESKFTLETAKKRFPEWYQRRIIDKQPKGTWKCKDDLYYWWIRKIKDGKDGAAVGHRYFCIMCLAIYGVKCGIDHKQVKEDAINLIPYLNKLDESGKQPFTESDVISALECYDERYITFPRDDISKLTGISIQANKRNYRPQAEHIKIMNFIRDEVNNNKEWRNKDGRPKGSGTKKDIIKQWQQDHPNGTPKECIKNTGISINTVYKWFKVEPDPTELEFAATKKPKDFNPKMYINAENMQELAHIMQEPKN